MSLRRPKVNIKDHNSDTYTASRHENNTHAKTKRKVMTVPAYLNVSNIMVNRTNFPNNGTTREVGGMISASKRKNTVSERRMLMDKDT